MKAEKLRELSTNLVANEETFMGNLCKNLYMYISQPDITLKEMSIESGIPFDTLNNILYRNTKDCKLSTVVALSNALGITIDELIGNPVLSSSEKECLQIMRNLPEHYQYLIRWFIKRQDVLSKDGFVKAKKSIPVMQLDEHNDGTLHLSNEFYTMDISDLPHNIRPQIFMGIELGVDNYVPSYTPYDILLIANDRYPKQNENSVIICSENLFIAHREPYGNHDYYSIRDGKFRFREQDIDEVIGYIAAKMTDFHHIMQKL